MSYPTAVSAAITVSGVEVLNLLGSGTGLTGLLNYMGVDLAAVETKLGTGASTAAANQLLVGTGSGTSAWQGLTSAQLAAIVSDETGSGLLVFGSSPTIVTPTIASFANANHDHSNSAGGGSLGQITTQSGTAPPAAGATTSGIKVSSTANFGIFWGSGAPTFSAAQGSIYLRTDGSSTSTRLYVNTTGSTTWTNFTSAT